MDVLVTFSMPALRGVMESAMESATGLFRCVLHHLPCHACAA